MKAASEKSASKKAAPKKAAPEKAASAKAVSKKAASEKAAPKKAAPQKAAAEKPAAKKPAPERAAASEKVAPKKDSSKEAATEKAAAPKAAAPDKAATEKAAASKAAVPDKAATEQAAASDTVVTEPAAAQSALSSAGEDANVEVHLLEAHESFPNNPQLPVLLYRAAFRLPGYGDAAAPIEKAFKRNGWSSGWRDGLYNYHHYHSTAHEVLGCYAGKSRVQIGGPQGPVLDFARGDVLVLPAGAAHKSIETSKDFSVVGSYAQGRSYDMRRGRPEELAEAQQHIADVPLPERDPVHGERGPLLRHWQAAKV